MVVRGVAEARGSDAGDGIVDVWLARGVWREFT